MEETEQILVENAKEYYRNATAAEKREEFNTAVTLYFKTLAALGDLIIYQKEHKIPSSHAERFRILEERYPETYLILDRTFGFYQDSYRRKMNKEISNILSEDAKKLLKELNISV
jgi:hypothetical protein